MRRERVRGRLASAAVVLGAGGSFDPQGPAAASMAELWWLMLWLGVAVFVLFLVLLVLGLVRRGAAAEDEDGPPPGDDPRLVRRWLVAGGVVLPLVVLLVVYGATLRSMLATSNEVPPDALVVEVVGHQWWWEVTYPDAGVTVANELHLPVGRPVALELTSADVIHSLWVPALAGKMDLLPEGSTTLLLQADRPGVHRTQCAEFCGLHHTSMKLVVVAEPPDDFAAWLDDPGPSDPDGPSVPEVVTPTDRAEE